MTTNETHEHTAIFGCPCVRINRHDGQPCLRVAYDGLRRQPIASADYYWYAIVASEPCLGRKIFAWLKSVPTHLVGHLNEDQREVRELAEYPGADWVPNRPQPLKVAVA